MHSALVLNASWEPLSVVPLHRAVVLVLRDKAEIVHRGEGELHSARTSMPVPSVIRLTRYVRVPFRARTPLSRRAVFLRDGGRCQYCGRPAENIDHVVPRSRGGEHRWENVVAACRRCNSSKDDRLLGETSLALAREPKAPHHTIWVVVAVGRIDPVWAPYLDLDDEVKATA